MKNLKLLVKTSIISTLSFITTCGLYAQGSHLLTKGPINAFLLSVVGLCVAALIFIVFEYFACKKRGIDEYERKILPAIQGMEKAKDSDEFKRFSERARTAIFCWLGAKHASVEDKARQTYRTVYRNTKKRLQKRN